MAELHMDRITQTLESYGFAVGLMHTGGGCYSLVIPMGVTVHRPVYIGPFHKDGTPQDGVVYVGPDEEMHPDEEHLVAETIEEVLDDVALWLSA